MWGAMRPTKEITPVTDTTAATIRVVIPSSRARHKVGSRPMLRALSSPRDSISTSRRKRSRRPRQTSTVMAGKTTLPAVIEARLPMVHTSRAASSRSGSAIIFSAISPASARAETTTPARM